MAATTAHRSRASARDAAVKNAVALLQQAMEIIDQGGVPLEVGARLQEVIDGLEAVYGE